MSKNDLCGLGLGAVAAMLLAIAAWMFDEMRRDGAPTLWVLIGLVLTAYDVGIMILVAGPTWRDIRTATATGEL